MSRVMGAEEGRHAARQLQTMVNLIDAGQLEASTLERAYITGRRDAMAEAFPQRPPRAPRQRRRVRRTDG